MVLLERKIRIVPEIEVSSLWGVPDDYKAREGTGLILAHGAGNDMNNPLLSYVHEALTERGVITVKFNFPYKERGGKAPDRAPVLEATWKAVIETLRSDPELAPNRTFFSGKSMGGRIASHLVAKGEHCAGLVFLGYPLHPPNYPEKRRTDHWPHIRCPMLFIQGTRDTLCDLDLLKTALKQMQAPVTLRVIEGGDHSFNVLKRLARSEQQVHEEIVDVISHWLADGLET